MSHKEREDQIKKAYERAKVAWAKLTPKEKRDYISRGIERIENGRKTKTGG
jgi:hypothetical protein